ncbi:MAG TPA: helicase-related protein, partial [Candidatus Methylomirabilis sp.]|nr:helicase-related protein [Candidatus Methylomirabilis sp.]
KYCPLWQADGNKIVRMAPAEYMGRYMPEWFDYSIADEIHQLAGDTAQGNALGVLNRTARRFLGLTGTLLSGYADDPFNTLFRTDAKRMTLDGYEWGSAGRERFTRDFGVIETIERITVEDNACSKKTKKTVTIKRKPGASPLLFGKYLMDHCAFIGLEDISDGLPSYREEVVSVGLKEPLKTAYEELEKEITACLKEHRGNSSVVSTMLNTLLGWPDHPYGFGTLYGSEFNPETNSRESFVIAETVDLDLNWSYAKERALIEEVKAQLARGRKCQVFAIYTNKHDVIERLEALFRNEGIRAATLRASVPTHRREAWYREQLRRGIDVAICHPKIVETGLDLLDFPTILFHETGYSLHTLRQSSRRSWRIGQRRPVEVKFFAYAGTMQEVCLRLMGKKLLVALAMEGKFASEGLQAIDGDDDMLTAMARELVENKGIGESADSVWRALGQLRPSSPVFCFEEPKNEPFERSGSEIPSILPLGIESNPNAAVMEGGSLARRSSRKLIEQGQLSLF